MLEFENQTRFPGAIVPASDKAGDEYLVTLLKATYAMLAGPGAPRPAEDPAPIVLADEYLGQPGESSVRYEAETCLRKAVTDVVVIGEAHNPTPRRGQMDVSVQVGPVKRVLRVFGDRHWQGSLGPWRMSSPEPFERMPITYERAFGGADRSAPNPKDHQFESRNPVGKGFVAAKSRLKPDEVPLPNVEDPATLLKSPKDRPAPAALGYLGRSFSPRRERAGTYDAHWEAERAPLIPEDFDETYWQGASSGMTTARFLVGGERVDLRGLSPSGQLSFALPSERYEGSFCSRDVWTPVPLVLDTLVLEPSLARFSLIFRGAIPCTRRLLFIDKVVVREAT